MIDGIYGVTSDIKFRQYSIMWKNQWYYYRLSYTDQTTTFGRAGSLAFANNKHIRLKTIVPLNEENFNATIERFEKLMLLQ